jgi:hypothetical protein
MQQDVAGPHVAVHEARGMELLKRPADTAYET